MVQLVHLYLMLQGSNITKTAHSSNGTPGSDDAQMAQMVQIAQLAIGSEDSITHTMVQLVHLYLMLQGSNITKIAQAQMALLAQIAR